MCFLISFCFVSKGVLSVGVNLGVFNFFLNLLRYNFVIHLF
ncbi:hypothetical protein RS022_06460 [Candidatus Phytoplasma rubi]|uniref:NADH dehydrogenase subunit 4L n=1 Tax=Candidatus Phytoplasma rubi TaxID=399025 RepID=A0ABY7BSX5_9MOLU|nr:hypothetical protein RS022_06460 [Candidatus Phytoplasma rubi]